MIVNSKMVKIIVTDSGGVEHIFHESYDVEHYLNLTPIGNFDQPIQGAVEIETHIFENNQEKCTTATRAIFIAPRRIDIIYEDSE